MPQKTSNDFWGTPEIYPPLVGVVGEGEVNLSPLLRGNGRRPRGIKLSLALRDEGYALEERRVRVPLTPAATHITIEHG